MLIGKNGSKLKEIKKRSRRDLQKFLDCKISLQLWVKVKEDWRKSDRDIKLMGYDQIN
jgi:GTP-binding protein Era